MSEHKQFVLKILIVFIAIGGYFYIKNQEAFISTENVISNQQENKISFVVESEKTELSALECPFYKEHQFPVLDGFVWNGEEVEIDFEAYKNLIPVKDIVLEEIEKGPNFAAYYRVIPLECGSNCQEYVIIDLNTGRVLETNFISSYTSSFSLNSRLFVLNPIDKTPENVADSIKVRYFQLNKKETPEMEILCPVE